MEEGSASSSVKLRLENSTLPPRKNTVEDGDAVEARHGVLKPFMSNRYNGLRSGFSHELHEHLLISRKPV